MRRRILDAAKSLFVRKGFDNVSMRGIAAAIEYSPAAIYRYFRNKREILTALREEGFDRIVSLQRQRAEMMPDPLERLREGGRAYVRFALRDPEYYHLMFNTGCHEVDLEGTCAANSFESFTLFGKTVEECVASGRFGEVPVRAAIFSVWSSLHGLANLILSGRVAALAPDADVDRMVDDVLDFTLRPAAGCAQPSEKSTKP